MTEPSRVHDAAGAAASPPLTSSPDARALALRHVRWGLWGLAAFACGGLILEALHALKVDAYLNAELETRRLMWRLAHAHGTLLALIQMAFGACVQAGLVADGVRLRLAARGLLAALVLIPAGFLGGGWGGSGGDPGGAIALVPVGALLLIAALVGAARSVERG